MVDSMPGSSSAFDPPHSGRQTPEPIPAPVFGSPTSTIGTPSATVPLRVPMRTVPSAEPYMTKKRVIIRVDPTITTCFDPSDKELYDLWAPKP